MFYTTEQKIEHYRDIINTMDAWLSNIEYNLEFKLENTPHSQVTDWCLERNAYVLVRAKALKLIEFIEKTEGR